MHRHFQKYFLILLIVIISMPGLLYLYYEAAQLHVHYRMEEALERSHLEVIKVATHQFHWEKKGKEIVVNGKMFDVHSIRKANGYIIVSGLFDEKETWIKQQMTLLRNAENQDTRSARQIIEHWHRLQWVNQFFTYQVGMMRGNAANVEICYSQSLKPCPFIYSILQPPEFFI